MEKLDSRLHAFRPDLADESLRGRVEAENFVGPAPAQVVAPIASLRKAPAGDAMQLTEALMGETVQVFERREGWAWVKLDGDGYVGYAAADALSEKIGEPTHRVAVPATHLYPAANIKSQPAEVVSLNARLTVAGEDGKFLRLADGRFVFAAHVKPWNEHEMDFIAVAGMFRHAPYCWGGKSARGLDCSGLVQLSLEACGMKAPRDSDMQERQLGEKLLVNDLDGLKRGDLVFWDGHVGIMTDGETLLHANGHRMMVVAEPLREAVERIARAYGQITSIKRLQ